MSALRWKVVTLPSGFIPSIVTDTTNEAEEIHITNVAGFSRTDKQDLDNASQIVVEHNAHDDLCAALEFILTQFSYKSPDDFCSTLSANMEKLEAALRQAGR